jgi:hypothetical protein
LLLLVPPCFRAGLLALAGFLTRALGLLLLGTAVCRAAGLAVAFLLLRLIGGLRLFAGAA